MCSKLASTGKASSPPSPVILEFLSEGHFRLGEQHAAIAFKSTGSTVEARDDSIAKQLQAFRCFTVNLPEPLWCLSRP